MVLSDSDGFVDEVEAAGRMPLKAMLASADLHAATLSELSLSTLSSHAELVVAVVPPLPFPSVPLSSFE